MVYTAHSFAESIDIAKAGTHSMVRCPGHEDGSASLHVSPGETHPVIMKCMAGCETRDVMAAAGWSLDEIMAERSDQWKSRCAVPTGARVHSAAGDASHVYEYSDEEGTLLFEVLRIPQQGGGKTFRQRHLDKSGNWVWNMEGVRRVLYRLPEVLAAKDAGHVVYLAEGEKDVETLLAQFELHNVDAIATTSPMGAGKWAKEYSETLAGADVIICADADDPGRKHARAVRLDLIEQGCDVTIMEPKQGAKDVTQHFERGGKLGNLLTTVRSDRWKRETYGIDVLQAITRTYKDTDYIIPNMLAEGDRLLLTGFEGTGKSELLRQLAVQVATGLHPWGTHPKFKPSRVLFFDSENHPQQTSDSWKNLLRVTEANDRPVEPGMLTIIESWDDEVDLTSADGRAWFLERVTAFRPRLICMGPLYNMVGRDLKEEEVVRKLKSVVNEARSIYGSAVIMEHHAPHKGPMDKKRMVRPYGSSMFLKWPDFGYGLQPVEDNENVFEWLKLRFPRVRSRYFPTHVRHGTPDSFEFPWEEAVEVSEGVYI